MPGAILRAFLVTTKICIGMPGALLTRSTVAECLHELIDLLVEELFCHLTFGNQDAQDTRPALVDGPEDHHRPIRCWSGPQVKDNFLL